MTICRNCKEEFKAGRNTKGIYCSNKCQAEYQYTQFISEWKQGLQTGNVSKTLALSKHVRKYMLEKTNSSCEECGWNKTHPSDDRALVEIDHIDGDASNTTEDNLKVLCPNCHSLTPTFRARNKRSARTARTS